MTLYEILSFNGELLHRLHEAGIRIGDYRYIGLFRDYEEMRNEGYKMTYIVAALAGRYAVSERKVYDLIRRLASDCKCGAV